ncbi:hypothetical protein NUW54_g2217 [Trametes sanguinea]|uniref:Uncharacterized protein n=1 Tax=Trametes sanguinea TaxID=158606 RepID=A0ACC1Q456_9APHY|nr:hypothetical protein NUW54_g2217 [Trametes sanguinea]
MSTTDVRNPVHVYHEGFPISPLNVGSQWIVVILESARGRAALFRSLSPRTLLLLARTCHKARDAVREYMAQAFDINATLSRFFDDPIGFRCIQARTGTLIAGSVALQFFDRTFYPSSDLDLYVYPQHRREVGLWLIQMGYHFSPSRGQDRNFGVSVVKSIPNSGLPYCMPGVSAIYTFHHNSLLECLKVQIIVAQYTPMEVILGFHSSESRFSPCNIALHVCL